MTDAAKEMTRLVEQWDATSEFDTTELYLFAEALVGAVRDHLLKQEQNP